MKKRVLLSLLILTIAASAVFAQIRSTTETKSRFPDDFRLVRVNSAGSDFYLGDRSGDTSRQRRTVKIKKSFYIANYPVTIWEWTRVMQGRNMGYPAYTSSGLLPMQGVSWYDAIEYCNARSRQDGLTAAYSISGSGSNRRVTWNKNANGWRLPTDAEWEVACRALTDTTYNFGNSASTSRANFGNSNKGPTPVDRYSPNDWGIYDMHGNVWEWVWDWYDPFCDDKGNARNLGVMTDPSGPTTKPRDDSWLTDGGPLFDDFRVLRGGSWDERAVNCTSATRMFLSGDFVDFGKPVPPVYARFSYGQDGILGFRIARNGN